MKSYDTMDIVIAKADSLRSSYDHLVEALREIEKGEGEFSTNPYEHACNTIRHMRQTARAALAGHGGICGHIFTLPHTGDTSCK